MSLTTVIQWASLFALAISIINTLWMWLSRPARDMHKKIDETNDRVDGLIEAADKRADRHREELKVHDRRIQKLEDTLPHMPTKDDLSGVGQKVTAIKTELDIVARTVNRIDDFLRKQP